MGNKSTPAANSDPPLKQEHVYRGVPYSISPAHPLADLFPWASEDEIDVMAAEIKDPRVGQKHPIDKLPDCRIIDGRSRELACLVAGVRPMCTTVRLAEYEIPAFIKAKNLTRRHLTESQRAMIAAKMANLPLGSNQHRTARATSAEGGAQAPPSAQPISQAQAAELLDVSRDSVKRANKVLREGTPELAAAVEVGRLDVKTAAQAAGLSPDEQREVAGAEQPKEAARTKLDRTNSANPSSRNRRPAGLYPAPVPTTVVRLRKLVEGIYPLTQRILDGPLREALIAALHRHGDPIKVEKALGYRMNEGPSSAVMEDSLSSQFVKAMLAALAEMPGATDRQAP